MADLVFHSSSSTLLYPKSPQELLNNQFVGQRIENVPGPAVILDLALVKKQCKQMLDASKFLGTSFRAHVKTHKTAELSELQDGDDPSTSARFIVSTVAEAEGLLPVLHKLKQQGREVNVLYGLAPSSTCFSRLSTIRDAIGPNSISFMIDHPAQLDNIANHFKNDVVPIYFKTDPGYGRAGLTPTSKSLHGLLEHALSLKDRIYALGFYTHLGSSYSVNTPDEALDCLSTELSEALAATEAAYAAGFPRSHRFTLSVGATPTAVSAQNLLAGTPTSNAAARVNDLLQKLKANHDVELHAGVYPVLDMQQMATHARPLQSNGTSTMTYDDIGIRILAEVLSVYTERGRPEALIGAGSIALGREPCKSYPGWAVVAPTPWDETKPIIYDPEKEKTGWIVGRVAQEHGILTWEGDIAALREIKVGEKLLLWPNHACIACANFGWCLVVDSSTGSGRETEVVEVWTRWRGW